MTVRHPTPRRRLALAAALLAAAVPAAAAAAPGPSPRGPSSAAALGPAAAATPAPARPLFGQQWSPWGAEPLGTSRVSVAAYGCALTASAMLLRTYGVAVDPGRLNRWLVAHGGYVAGDLLVWSAVARAAAAMGGSVRYEGWGPYDRAVVDAALAAGNPVIAQVSLDGAMHFVLIVAVSPDGTMWVNDPWYGDVTTLQARYGDPGRAILSIRLFSGRAVPAPTVSALHPGGTGAVQAPPGTIGRGGPGAEVLAVPDTTPTTLWTRGTPAPVVSWTATTVRFTAPDPLSAGSLVVRTPTGQPNYWFPFTVPGVPAVRVAGLSPASGVLRGGTWVVVRGSGFIAPMTVRFGLVAARRVVVVSPTEIIAVSPGVSALPPRGPTPPAPTPSPTPTPARSPRPTPSLAGGIPRDPYAIARPPLALGMAATVRVALTVADWMGTSPVGVASVFAYAAVPVASPAPATPPPATPRPAAPTTTPSPNPITSQPTPTPSAPPSATAPPPGAPLAAAAGSAFHPLPAFAVLEPARGQGPGAVALEAGAARTVPVDGVGGVPRSGATWVALAVTATATAGRATVSVGGSPITAAAGAPMSGLVLVRPGPGGAISVHDGGAPVRLSVDLVGWFGPARGGRGVFHPLAPPVGCGAPAPAASGCGAATVTGSGTLVLPLLDGRWGVPAGAGAVLLDLSVLTPASQGSVSIFPGGSPGPGATVLTFAAGETERGQALVALGEGGFVGVTVAAATAALQVSLVGWFGPG